jgi:AmmeMemoRadiSam system protein B
LEHSGPSVAGSSRGNSEALNAQIRAAFLAPLTPKTSCRKPVGPRQVLGLVCPHAGYVYSGAVAANAYFL